jgi:eukaryotic-like serine/threonine-protein kinase
MSSPASILSLVASLELRLGNGFAIEGEVAKGGMSRIYSARRPDTRDRIAIKVMVDRLSGASGPERFELEERFLLEMQVLQKLNHPRIPAVLSSGDVSGSLYYTMPFVEGETLRSRLKRRDHISVRDALLFTRDVADALGHVHENGIIHRDVKPDNLMLSPTGVWLLDFGIARAPAFNPADMGIERPRYIMGTPEYTSPERLTARVIEDARSDLFSLGCVFYEMLSGRPPFPNGLRDAMKKHAPNLPIDLAPLPPNLPDEVMAVLRRSIALHPSDRFVNATAMLAATDAAVKHVGYD